MIRVGARIVAGASLGALYIRERRFRVAMERLSAAALETLLNAIDANNEVTGAHVRRVAEYALTLAEAADCDEKVKRSIERVALFHDIGKIDGGLSDIIKDAKKLTPADRRAIMTHADGGAKVLAPLAPFYPDLPEGVVAHHERWDGSGYPRGLRGARIPFSARVVSIADTFDAVTHARPYRGAQSIEKGMEVIACGRGTQFDPDLVDLFLSPPVMDGLMAAIRKEFSPKRRGEKRRRRHEEDRAPDIKFRWRTQAGSRQTADL
jgi:HD-GYP domain-containing protein (c-di-GMP phosphodiesterase class II)